MNNDKNKAGISKKLGVTAGAIWALVKLADKESVIAWACLVGIILITTVYLYIQGGIDRK